MAGMLITFEGLERSGKGTQIALLKEYLEKRGVTVIVGREPGGTAYGEAARRLVQDPEFIKRLNTAYTDVPGTAPLDVNDELNETGELFGYLLARALFVERRVKPAINEGKLFIADRYGDSSVAYQGYGNWDGEPDAVEFIKRCNNFCYGGTPITRTYLLDIPVEESFSRKGDGEFGGEKDRIEQREKDWFTRVRNGYLALAQEDPSRWYIIDGLKTREEIFAIIKEDIDPLL